MSGRGMQPTYYSQFTIEEACSWSVNSGIKDFDRCMIDICIKYSKVKECKAKSVRPPNKDDINMSLPDCNDVLNTIHYEKKDNDYIAINSKTKQVVKECEVKGNKQDEHPKQDESKFCFFDGIVHKNYVCPDSWGLTTCGTLTTSCYSGPVDEMQTLKLFPQAQCSEHFLFNNCKDGRTIKGQECFFRPNGESIDKSCSNYVSPTRTVTGVNTSTIHTSYSSESNVLPTQTSVATSTGTRVTGSTATSANNAANNRVNFVYINLFMLLVLSMM